MLKIGVNCPSDRRSGSAQISSVSSFSGTGSRHVLTAQKVQSAAVGEPEGLLARLRIRTAILFSGRHLIEAKSA
jgi:hypothetical protein